MIIIVIFTEGWDGLVDERTDVSVFPSKIDTLLSFGLMIGKSDKTFKLKHWKSNVLLWNKNVNTPREWVLIVGRKVIFHANVFLIQKISILFAHSSCFDLTIKFYHLRKSNSILLNKLIAYNFFIQILLTSVQDGKRDREWHGFNGKF